MYRIIFDIQEDSDDGPRVRVLRIWHGSRDQVRREDLEESAGGGGEDGALRLVPVEIAAEAALPARCCAWELSTAEGHVLRAFATIDGAVLAEILAALVGVERR